MSPANGATSSGAGVDSQLNPRPASFSSEHVVCFYQRTDSLLDALGDFVGSALREDGGAIVVATKAHVDGLEKLLESRGVDLTGARKKYRYLALDASETLTKIMVAGMPDGARFAKIIGGIIGKTRAAAKGKPPVVFGEMVAL